MPDSINKFGFITFTKNRNGDYSQIDWTKKMLRQASEAKRYIMYKGQ